eukprot:747600-Hanusia_phi.AAC.2
MLSALLPSTPSACAKPLVPGVSVRRPGARVMGQVTSVTSWNMDWNLGLDQKQHQSRNGGDETGKTGADRCRCQELPTSPAASFSPQSSHPS